MSPEEREERERSGGGASQSDTLPYFISPNAILQLPRPLRVSDRRVCSAVFSFLVRDIIAEKNVEEGE